MTTPSERAHEPPPQATETSGLRIPPPRGQPWQAGPGRAVLGSEVAQGLMDLADTARLGVVVVCQSDGGHWVVRRVNRALGTILGAAPREIEGTEASAWLPEALAAGFPSPDGNGGPASNRVETPIQRADGSIGQVEAWNHPISYHGREAVLILVRQTTDEEAALSESEDRYRSLVEVSPDGIIVFQERGIVFANTRGLEMLDAPSLPALRARDPASWIVPEDRDALTDLVQTCLSGETPEPLETWLARPDGQPVHVEISFAPTLSQGEPAVQLVLHDITELKARQGELEELTQELEQRNQDLSDFARVAGHDLKEPLRMVTGFLDLYDRRYGDRVGSEEARSYLERARHGAHRTQELLEGLARFAGVETGGMHPKPVDSGKLLSHALASLAMTIEEAQAEVSWDELPEVMADPPLLTQVFQNLVSNAIKYSGDVRPEVHVSVEPEGDVWRFHVDDNGIGIPPEHTETVFEPLRRLQRSGEGTGMGLTIVKRIIDRHGGDVTLSPRPGRGTRVSFSLPAVHGAAAG